MTRRLPLRWIDGNRQRRVVELLLILWLLSAVDLVLTLWAQRYTLFSEFNPVGKTLLDGNHLRGIALFKLVMLSVGSLLLWITRRNRAAEAALWLLAVVHVGLMFQWSVYTAHAQEFADSKRNLECAGIPFITDWDAYTKRQWQGAVASAGPVNARLSNLTRVTR